MSAATINENDSVTLTGTVSDVGTLDTQTVTILWGAGEGSTVLSGAQLTPVAGQSGVYTFSATHQYLDDNPSGTPSDNYTISVSSTDDDGGVSAAVSQTLAVTNVCRRRPSPCAASSPEGTSISLGSTVSDPGTLDTFTYAWSVTKDGHAYAAGSDTSFAFTPDDNGTYVVTLAITDDDTGVGTDTQTITVTNVAPTLTSVAATSVINENGTATVTGLLSDPGTADTFTLTVDWGDPLSPSNVETYTFAASAGGSQPFTLMHQYLDDNPTGTAADDYTIGLVAADNESGTGTGSTSVTVNNVAPTLSGLSATTISENGVTTLTGTITDPGTLDTFTLTVNWGDPLSPNNVETYTFGASATGSQTFTLTHQYFDDNPTATASDSYTIGLGVTDDDTGSGAGNATVTVNNVSARPERPVRDHDQ